MPDLQPRSLHAFRDGMTMAERRVLDELDTGEPIVMGENLPGMDAGTERRIRARFLRWVILGCEGSGNRVHEKGVQIVGALITGEGPDRTAHASLDLLGASVACDVLLVDCRFTAPPNLQSARMQGLFLSGSHLPELDADGLETRGDVALEALTCPGEVRLPGAIIGGDLYCDGATLGEASDNALVANGARIAGGFFWRRGASAHGLMDLTAAEIGRLCDDPNCWPEAGRLGLDRCRYGAFTGKGVSAGERIDWLSRLWDPEYDFLPQPYEHCAKVLREMGHADDARDVLIEKERLQRRARRRKETGPLRWGMALRDWCLGWSVRYGQKPLRAAWYLLALWLLGVAAFQATWDAGAFKPNNAFVLRSADWTGCSTDAGPYAFRKNTAGATQLGCFQQTTGGRGYPEFNAWVYSLDVLFPLVQLEQQVHWVPNEDLWPTGWLARGLVYLNILLGWVLSLLAVAGLSGLIKSD